MAGAGGSKECFGCGSFDHVKIDCPARNKTCDTCGKLGHLARKCNVRDVRDVREHRDSRDMVCRRLDHLFFGLWLPACSLVLALVSDWGE